MTERTDRALTASGATLDQFDVTRDDGSRGEYPGNRVVRGAVTRQARDAGTRDVDQAHSADRSLGRRTGVAEEGTQIIELDGDEH